MPLRRITEMILFDFNVIKPNDTTKPSSKLRVPRKTALLKGRRGGDRAGAECALGHVHGVGLFGEKGNEESSCDGSNDDSGHHASGNASGFSLVHTLEETFREIAEAHSAKVEKRRNVGGVARPLICTAGDTGGDFAGSLGLATISSGVDGLADALLSATNGSNDTRVNGATIVVVARKTGTASNASSGCWLAHASAKVAAAGNGRVDANSVHGRHFTPFDEIELARG